MQVKPASPSFIFRVFQCAVSKGRCCPVKQRLLPRLFLFTVQGFEMQKSQFRVSAVEQERIHVPAGVAEPRVTIGRRLSCALLLIPLQQTQDQKVCPFAEAALMPLIQREISQRFQSPVEDGP